MAVFDMARILLYVDGGVHICLPNYRTFFATPDNLMKFFQQPLDFIEKEVHNEDESTQIVNPKRLPLEKLPGVSLAHFSSAGKITCHFPELFSFLFEASKDENQKNMHLNMQSFILEHDLSNANSFLLQYYLNFVKSFDTNTSIRNKLEIDEDVLFSTLREIFNSVFAIEPKKPPKKSLDDKVNDIVQGQLFGSSTNSETDDAISVTEYAVMHGVPRSDILYQIKKGTLKTAVQLPNGQYRINKNEPFLGVKNKIKIRPSNDSDDEVFLGNPEDWPAARVEKYIRDNKLYSPIVAKYVYSKQEIDYYVSVGFMEVDWNNRRCLIQDVDINFVAEDGVSNLERMRNGNPPLAYDQKEGYKPWEIHHLGQRDKVFVTLPHHIHNGTGYKSIFHASAPNQNLHGPQFEQEKKMFWKWLAEQYSRVKIFKQIPHIYPCKGTKIK